MLAHMKKRPMDDVRVTIDGQKPRVFSIPKRKAKGLVILLENFEVDDNEEEGNVPAEEVFKDLYDKYGKSGTTLRGARGIHNMTQVQLAQLIGIPQTDISQMENGKRPIGKKMAKRLAKVFKTDYRVFL